jgi:hypothetical protein
MGATYRRSVKRELERARTQLRGLAVHIARASEKYTPEDYPDIYQAFDTIKQLMVHMDIILDDLLLII